MADSDSDPDTQSSAISLSAPWNAGARFARGNINAQSARYLSKDEAKSFIEKRTDLHAIYIRETERTRRFTLGLAASLLALASVVPFIAPEGRESISHFVSLALLVFAAGAVGYSKVRLSSKDKVFSFSQGQDDA